jgi:pyruvate, water dikinase
MPPHDARKAIERRKQLELAFYLASDGKTHLIEDQDAVRSVRQAFQPEQSMDGIEEVRGVCGSKGKADGKARIVMGASDFHKMQKGDVLVTSMTTPDFVPLMQKASAIVTDMGGLLSHAVIMSRELGKPCVIGTKFATQAFKDGDMVEVDAEKGVVRKI